VRSADARRLLGAFLHSAYDSLPFRGPPRDPNLAMSLPPYDPRNEIEIAYWNGAGGRNWVHRQEIQDTILAPILRAAIERAAVRPGELVVDVGCGTGATSIELGGRVGHSGHVLGVDVSGPMLARAAERLPTDVHRVRARGRDDLPVQARGFRSAVLAVRRDVLRRARARFYEPAHCAAAGRAAHLRLLA
jgi:SAM-dependent methyltransferase